MTIIIFILFSVAMVLAGITASYIAMGEDNRIRFRNHRTLMGCYKVVSDVQLTAITESINRTGEINNDFIRTKINAATDGYMTDAKVFKETDREAIKERVATFVASMYPVTN